MSNPTEVLSDVLSGAPTEQLIEELGRYTLPLVWTLRQKATRAFHPLGLRTVRALLLEYVGRGYGYPKDLAEILGLVAPAVSTMIAELEDRGLLRRKGHPIDGRRIRLELTEAGHEAREELNAAWRRVGLSRLATLSAEELELFTRLCRKLSEEPELQGDS